MEENHGDEVLDLNHLGRGPDGLDLNDLTPPWQRPGGVRRDCVPHRGPTLLWLANAALLCGPLAFCLAVPGVIGLPLGVLAYVLAGRDLDKMRRGVMDPSGRKQAEQAQRRAMVGVVICMLGMVFWGSAVLAGLFLFG